MWAGNRPEADDPVRFAERSVNAPASRHPAYLPGTAQQFPLFRVSLLNRRRLLKPDRRLSIRQTTKAIKSCEPTRKNWLLIQPTSTRWWDHSYRIAHRLPTNG